MTDQGMVPYRPSNGSEGADFMERWCAKCARDRAFRDEAGESCSIAAYTMVFRVDDPAYPKEWREDGPSGPRCTAFEALDGTDQPLDPAAAVGLLV